VYNENIMKYKKVLIVLCAVLFFLTALTTYLNRVIFPRLIKKFAVERIEEALKRKVEIGSIHFNWVRGIIIDKFKVYEKDSNDAVFAQADQVSFGIIFFPGSKRTRITIPFINVRSPSVRLIRTGIDIWNFSDISAPPPATPPKPTYAKTEKSPAFDIAWGGITISDGKFLVEDISASPPWNEFFDNINLKLSLSTKGISYAFTADIPGKKGFVGATVYYQPVTRNTQAEIHLKNINTASYLSLINIPDMKIDSGIIKEINLNINYTQDKTSAQGDLVMNNWDITSHDNTFKGDIEIRSLNAQYQNGDIRARGQMTLSHMQSKVPGLSAGGSVQTNVREFELTKEGVTFIGSIHGQNILLNLEDFQVQADEMALDNIKIKKDKGEIQSVGSITTKGLLVQRPNQKIQGDFALKAMTMRLKDVNDIVLEGELQADHFSTLIDDKNISSRHLLLEDARLNILNQKNMTLNTKLSLDVITMVLGENRWASSASIKTDKLLFSLDDGIIKVTANLKASEGKLVLENHKIIEADPQLELTLQMPLSAPQELTYKGSVTLSDGRIRGFAPIQSLENIELDADFHNDEATINALSVNILDTNVRANGTVKNFENPVLNIVAEANELNLAKIKDLAPRMVEQYGLSFDGTSYVKVQFEGLAMDPLTAKILAVATVKNVSVESGKFHQKIKNITGIVEATTDSLKWRNFTATYLGNKYNMAGSLENFTNPEILTTIDGPDLRLKADIVKNNDLITVNAVTGKYMNADFDGKGTITLPAGQDPVFDINGNVTLLLENLMQALPASQKKSLQPLNPVGMVSMTAVLKGMGLDWKNYNLNATVTSPAVNLRGYNLTGMKISIEQGEGKVKNLTFDGKLYGGTVHAVGSLDLTARGMPYDLALNINNTNLRQLKMDSPLKMEEINGNCFLTFLAHGTTDDFKNKLHATGSLAIRDGFLGEFNLFKGLLTTLNDILRLGQVMITDVEGNFTIEDQKINTENLRLKGPTIVLLGKGWVNFDQICDLNITVDLSSGVVPAMAHDVLNTLNIHIYDKINNPKFKKKISVPQVINTFFRNLLQ
jgi:AsmA-like C-terminal region